MKSKIYRKWLDDTPGVESYVSLDFYLNQVGFHLADCGRRVSIELTNKNKKKYVILKKALEEAGRFLGFEE